MDLWSIWWAEAYIKDANRGNAEVYKTTGKSPIVGNHPRGWNFFCPRSCLIFRVCSSGALHARHAVQEDEWDRVSCCTSARCCAGGCQCRHPSLTGCTAAHLPESPFPGAFLLQGVANKADAGSLPTEVPAPRGEVFEMVPLTPAEPSRSHPWSSRSLPEHPTRRPLSAVSAQAPCTQLYSRQGPICKGRRSRRE